MPVKAVMKKPAGQPMKAATAKRSMKAKGSVDVASSDDEKGGLELTADALHKLDFEQKVKHFQDGAVKDEAFWQSLDAEEKMRAWKRFEYGRTKNEQAMTQWNSMNKKLGRGDSKDNKKRMLLLSFLKEGKCGEFYFSAYETLQVSKEDATNMQWAPWAECTRWYGVEEAKARVASGSLTVRKSPNDDKFFEFLLVKDSSKLTSMQRKTLETTRSTKLSKAEYKALSEGILGQHDKSFMQDLLSNNEESGGSHVSFKQLMEAANDDDAEPAAGPSDLQSLLDGTQEPGAKKPRQAGHGKPTLEDKADKLSTFGAETDKEQAIIRCNQMHSLVSKKVSEIDLLPLDKKKANTLILLADLIAIKVKLETHVTQRSGTMKAMKALLLDAAKNIKKARDVSQK